MEATATKLNITEVIEALIVEFISTVNFCPKNAMDINGGQCEDFGQAVMEQVDGANGFWGDELDEEFWGIEDECWMSHHAPYHYFVLFDGKYYDSEAPNGVFHPKDLPYYQREQEYILTHCR